MTRILLTGDSQVGAGPDLGIGEHGPGSRLQDQIDTLGRIAEIAHAENVDAVAHLGDVFERPMPPPWQVIGVQKWIRELELPTVFVLGNHDLKSPSLPHVLGVFTDQVQVFDTPGVFDLAGAPVAVLPWAPMARMAAGESLPRAELKRRTVEALVLVMQQLRVEAGDGAVLLGHWAVSGSTLPSGEGIEAFMDEPIVPWPDIDALGFRLAAFGHIHAPQVIAQDTADTPMLYVGSPSACNFGEAGTPHGVWIWDDAGEGSLRFVEVSDRAFLTYDFSVEEAMSLLSGGEPERPFDGAFVRIRWHGTEAEAALMDEGAVRKAVLDAGARRVFVKGTVERTSRARVEIADESLSPTDALELWLLHNEPAIDVDELRAEHARLVEAL